MRKKKIEIGLMDLENELKETIVDIEKTTEEMNARRRLISELKSKRTILENQIKAKKLEQLEDDVTNKYGMSMEAFMAAVKSGDILVDNKEESSNSQSSSISTESHSK